MSHPPVFACILVGSFIELLLPVPPSHLQHINTDLEVYFIFIFSSQTSGISPSQNRNGPRSTIYSLFLRRALLRGGGGRRRLEVFLYAQIMYGAARR